MANPRATTAYDGIDGTYETYDTDGTTITFDEDEVGGSAQVGLAVALSAARTIELVGDGEEVLGKLIKVERDGYGTVQTGGYMTLPAGTGASLTLGKKIVGDLLVAAEGYIREVATGTAAELGVATGAIIDASDTTAVVVRK